MLDTRFWMKDIFFDFSSIQYPETSIQNPASITIRGVYHGLNRDSDL
jgi:hypothetical protein